MGGAAAKAMVAVGHQVYGYDTDEKNMAAARENGVIPVHGMDELTSNPVVLFSLPGPPDVKAVVAADGGAIELFPKGTILVDLSTVDPQTSQEMSAVASEAGLEYLDSPVLGMKGAVGNWILPIGGNREAYDKCTALLSSIASKTFYVGASGKGSALKLLNNLMVGAMANGINEVMALSEIVGLSPQILLEVIGESKAPTNNPMFRSRTEKIINNDFEPTFKLDLLAKDVDLGNKMARSHGVHLVTGGTVDMVQKLAQRKGLGQKDFSSLYLYYTKLFSEEL
jgi:3-hydroxyisobutyrate dehydrogenase-like beta-hydroxyacid dehydrogenase